MGSPWCLPPQGGVWSAEVVKAIKSVFPEGKGVNKSTKEVFAAEVKVEDEQHDLQCALDVMAAEGQERDGEDEEILHGSL